MNTNMSIADAAGPELNWRVQCDEHLTVFLKEELAETFNAQMTILLALHALGQVKKLEIMTSGQPAKLNMFQRENLGHLRKTN